MRRAFPQNFLSNRFQIKTFICKQKIHRYLSGTVHYEHPLIDQMLEIDENGQLLHLPSTPQKQEHERKTENNEICVTLSKLSVNEKITQFSQNFNSKESVKNSLPIQEIENEQEDKKGKDSNHLVLKTKKIVKKTQTRQKSLKVARQLHKLDVSFNIRVTRQKGAKPKN